MGRSASAMIVSASPSTWSKESSRIALFHSRGDPRKFRRGWRRGGLVATGELNERGEITGAWETSLSSAGRFVLYPHGRLGVKRPEPDQLFSCRKDWGPIAIDRDGIHALAAKIQEHFSRPVVLTVESKSTYTAQLARFSEHSFPDERAGLLKLQAQDPEQGGLFRTVILEFGQSMNFITTQSTDESWARGTLGVIAQHIDHYERSYATNIKRFGFGVNQVLLVGTLIALPSLDTYLQRGALIAVLILTTWSITEFHKRYLPNATIWLVPKKSSPFGTQVASWIASIIAMIVATLAAAAIQGVIPSPWPDLGS